MTAATATFDSPASLAFEQGASKAVGLHGGLVDKLRANAPRIVGMLKIVGLISAASTLEPFLVGLAVFHGIGQIISIAYGSKANQKKTAQETNTEIEKESHTIAGNIQKVFKPRQYPVEANAGFAMVGETLGAGYGVKLLSEGVPGGLAPLLIGVIATFAYGHILFGKEKTQQDAASDTEELTFAESKSRPTGITGRFRAMMKHNPVLVSSLIFAGICLGGLITGLMSPEIEVGYTITLALGVVANLIQAAFVTKKDFNIEGAKENMENPEHAAKVASASSFKERIEEKRMSDPGPQRA